MYVAVYLCLKVPVATRGFSHASHYVPSVFTIIAQMCNNSKYGGMDLCAGQPRGAVLMRIGLIQCMVHI